jgi:TRAP transporter TAXI family solute receptor
MTNLMIGKIVRRTLAATLSGALIAFGATTQAAQNLRLSTLAPGTSPYIVMTTFANIVNEQLPQYQVQVNATGAGTRHAIETAQGKSEFFMNAPGLFNLMQKEIGPFSKVPGAGELSKNIRSVFNFPMGAYHITTFADSGITRLEDLKGKRVFLGPPGGAAYVTTSRLVEAVTGMKPDKDYEVARLGWDAAAQSFQDGHIDVYFNPTLAPSPAISQIAMLNKIRLLEIPQDKIKTQGVQALIKRPGFRLDEIPAGAYGSGQINTAAATTIGATVGVGTHKDVPDEVIYAVTKAFWENLAERAKGTPMLQQIQLKNAFVDINAPLHPGALRYYREQGMEIPPAALDQ